MSIKVLYLTENFYRPTPKTNLWYFPDRRSGMANLSYVGASP